MWHNAGCVWVSYTHARISLVEMEGFSAVSMKTKKAEETDSDADADTPAPSKTPVKRRGPGADAEEEDGEEADAVDSAVKDVADDSKTPTAADGDADAKVEDGGEEEDGDEEEEEKDGQARAGAVFPRDEPIDAAEKAARAGWVKEYEKCTKMPAVQPGEVLFIHNTGQFGRVVWPGYFPIGPISSKVPDAKKRGVKHTGKERPVKIVVPTDDQPQITGKNLVYLEILDHKGPQGVFDMMKITEAEREKNRNHRRFKELSVINSKSLEIIAEETARRVAESGEPVAESELKDFKWTVGSKKMDMKRLEKSRKEMAKAKTDRGTHNKDDSWATFLTEYKLSPRPASLKSPKTKIVHTNFKTYLGGVLSEVATCVCTLVLSSATTAELNTFRIEKAGPRKALHDAMLSYLGLTFTHKNMECWEMANKQYVTAELTEKYGGMVYPFIKNPEDLIAWVCSAAGKRSMEKAGNPVYGSNLDAENPGHRKVKEPVAAKKADAKKTTTKTADTVPAKKKKEGTKKAEKAPEDKKSKKKDAPEQPTAPWKAAEAAQNKALESKIDLCLKKLDECVMFQKKSSKNDELMMEIMNDWLKKSQPVGVHGHAKGKAEVTTKRAATEEGGGATVEKYSVLAQKLLADTGTDPTGKMVVASEPGAKQKKPASKKTKEKTAPAAAAEEPKQPPPPPPASKSVADSSKKRKETDTPASSSSETQPPTKKVRSVEDADKKKAAAAEPTSNGVHVDEPKVDVPKEKKKEKKTEEPAPAPVVAATASETKSLYAESQDGYLDIAI